MYMFGKIVETMVEGNLREILEKGYVTIAGEASDDDILMEAGIERASGLIAVVSTEEWLRVCSVPMLLTS